MRAIRSCLALLILALAVPPAAGQAGKPVESCSRQCDPHDTDVNGPGIRTLGPVDVILYGHFRDILTMAPLNTQAPDPKREPDQNQGFLMPVIYTNLPCGTSCNLNFRNNVFVLYSSAGLVEYREEGWRTHQGSGLGYPIEIAKDRVNLYWYMSARTVPKHGLTEPLEPWTRVGVMPSVAVSGRMETGRFPGRGLVIAEGDTGNQRTHMISMPFEPDVVYEFRVPLRVYSSEIPSNPAYGGFIVSVIPYQFRSEGSTEIAQNEWRIRTGARFPPRLVLPVSNPLEGRGVEVKLWNGTAYVRSYFQSPFGNYDIPPETLRLEVRGPSHIPANAIRLERVWAQYDHENWHPLNVTWSVDAPIALLAPGRYTIHVSAENLQHTFRAEQSAEFVVAGFSGASEIPSLPAGLVLLGIAVTITRLRKRDPARTAR